MRLYHLCKYCVHSSSTYRFDQKGTYLFVTSQLQQLLSINLLSLLSVFTLLLLHAERDNFCQINSRYSSQFFLFHFSLNLYNTRQILITPQPTMSQKITSKNLSYNTELPPFLARLRGQGGGQYGDTDGPDPILAARRRPAGRHVRTASEEAEDAPVVVDEDGNVVDLQGKDVESLTQGEEKDNKTESKEEGANKEKEEEKEKEKVAGIGASKKRKVGRVIGGDADEEGDRSIAKAASDVRRILDAGKLSGKDRKTTDASTKATATAKNGKKKAKKIKLSFGDDAD
ncbi:hypothetical protein F4810DRAFT_415193 [Camillea tinctor]|nr:hypothetical protein F4810DRAFT_415193 [Camillea tinctor]